MSRTRYTRIFLELFMVNWLIQSPLFHSLQKTRGRFEVRKSVQRKKLGLCGSVHLTSSEICVHSFGSESLQFVERVPVCRLRDRGHVGSRNRDDFSLFGGEKVVEIGRSCGGQSTRCVPFTEVFLVCVQRHVTCFPGVVPVN